MAWQPPPSAAPPPAQDKKAAEKTKEQEMDFYELLQVNRDSHPTIIRYAYRFLAAMYHPDNGETGDADKFRTISEAWRTLSDEGKRAAYDLSLGILDQRKTENKTIEKEQPQFKRESLPHSPKTNLTWDEIELRIAVLQVLLEARRKRPATGGASGKMLMDCLNIDNVGVIEFALWYLREKGYAEMGERYFMITAAGVDYLTDQLSKTQILGGGSATEEKTRALLEASKSTMH